MRWMAFLALAAFLAEPGLFAQTAPTPTAPTKQPQPPKGLPRPVAEPENAQEYAKPTREAPTGPTAADIGPAQRPFVLARDTDDLETAQVEDNSVMNAAQNLKIDKRISVPLIHDVQNDLSYKGTDNHALDFELTYLNWGAVTAEQKQARRGHYFTITSVNDGPKGDYTARFEYRQVNSKEVVRTLTQPLHNFSGAARSYFGVVDKAYLAYGPVCSWRFSILKGGTIVAQTRSYVW